MGVAVGPGSCPCPSVRIREDRARQHQPSAGELGLGVWGRGDAKSIRAGLASFLARLEVGSFANRWLGQEPAALSSLDPVGHRCGRKLGESVLNAPCVYSIEKG